MPISWTMSWTSSSFSRASLTGKFKIKAKKSSAEAVPSEARSRDRGRLGVLVTRKSLVKINPVSSWQFIFVKKYNFINDYNY